MVYHLLNGDSPYWEHIEQHRQDAEAERSVIYVSTVCFAEVRPKRLGKPDQTPQSLMAGVLGVARVFDSTPDIMSAAGMLRDNTYALVELAAGGKRPTRDLGMGDAVQLATALFLKNVVGLTNLEFHTFDDGKSKGPEGKNVPLLSFERWCWGLDDVEIVQDVKALKRKRPEHPSCRLPTRPS